MFGINPSEFLVLLLVAAVVLGPERLPQYTQQLTRLVRLLRRMAQGAADQVRTEMGPEFDDVDWRKLDPRQYDPRRIVREALSDVVDPDDPLGLADLSLPRWPPSGAGETDRPEPLSPGSREPEDRDGGRGRDPAGGRGGGPGASPVPFDPDAT